MRISPDCTEKGIDVGGGSTKRRRVGAAAIAGSSGACPLLPRSVFGSLRAAARQRGRRRSAAGVDAGPAAGVDAARRPGALVPGAKAGTPPATVGGAGRARRAAPARVPCGGRRRGTHVRRVRVPVVTSVIRLAPPSVRPAKQEHAPGPPVVTDTVGAMPTFAQGAVPAPTAVPAAAASADPAPAAASAATATSDSTSTPDASSTARAARTMQLYDASTPPDPTSSQASSTRRTRHPAPTVRPTRRAEVPHRRRRTRHRPRAIRPPPPARRRRAARPTDGRDTTPAPPDRHRPRAIRRERRRPRPPTSANPGDADEPRHLDDHHDTDGRADCVAALSVDGPTAGGRLSRSSATPSVGSTVTFAASPRRR